MPPIQPGAQAPPIPGAELDGPRAVLFYKVTCPTCQMAAPPVERLFRAFADRFVAVVQDPPERAREFAQEHDTSFPSITDEPPYEISGGWGIRTVPTLFIVADGRVDDVVESWDREGWNRAAARLGDLVGVGAAPVSHEGDGLPPFRPG